MVFFHNLSVTSVSLPSALAITRPSERREHSRFLCNYKKWLVRLFVCTINPLLSREGKTYVGISTAWAKGRLFTPGAITASNGTKNEREKEKT